MARSCPGSRRSSRGPDPRRPGDPGVEIRGPDWLRGPGAGYEEWARGWGAARGSGTLGARCGGHRGVQRRAGRVERVREGGGSSGSGSATAASRGCGPVLSAPTAPPPDWSGGPGGEGRVRRNPLGEDGAAGKRAGSSVFQRDEVGRVVTQDFSRTQDLSSERYTDRGARPQPRPQVSLPRSRLRWDSPERRSLLLFQILEAGPGGGAARGPPLPPGALPGDPRTLGRPSAGVISGRREAGPLPPPRGPGTPPAHLRPRSPCARVRLPVATEFILPITWAARVSASYAVVLATLDPRPGGYFGAGTRHLKIQ